MMNFDGEETPVTPAESSNGDDDTQTASEPTAETPAEDGEASAE